MINLDQNYDRADFIDFLQNTFFSDYIRDVRPISTQGLSSISKAVSLGRSDSLDLQVFEFEYTGSANKRVTLTKEAFQIMKQSATFNALAVFYGQDSEDWRLSFLTANPERTEKGKVTLAYSNPRRYSFFLGSNAKINTPTKFLLSRGKIASFDDLKSRFSIEVVNKEFYKEISKAFTSLSNGLLKLPFVQEKSQTNLEFAVRLIGRIIFCWFLREKKSETGTALMPNELLSLDAVSQNEDYYHKILEPIFFEVLNKPVKSRKDEFSKDPFSSVPYLNGGLFSPQDDDYYKRSNGDYQSQFHNTLVVPDSWFKEFFETLETYNFTIDENTSFDEELSIDPEMLGRIFENLLAEINPETGESARKATGSYYTPRTIVSYMVDESLLLYLKQKTNVDENKLRAIISYDLTDDTNYPISQEEKEKIIDALENLKLLDPACGSGAFPIGALQKIVFVLQQIDPDGQLWFRKQLIRTSPELRRVIEREFEHQNFDYIRKLGIIRENIYGIDIQPIATEISRLRCFLTLIVDERVQDELENRGIEPLPNLDFKFVTANSLTGLPTSRNINQMGLFEDDQGIKELKELRDMFFTATGVEREQLKLQFVQAQNKMFQRMIEGGTKGYADLTTRLSGWDPFSHKASTWFDPEWMFGIKDGFDIVIANPPYVGFHGIKSIRDQLTKDYRSAKGKFDLYLVFIEKGLQLAKEGCFVTYICPTNFMKRSHGEALRKLLTSESQIIEVVDFSHKQMFDTVTNYTGIFIFQKGMPDGKHSIKYKQGAVDSQTINYQQDQLSSKSWVFRPEKIESIVKKMEKHPRLFSIARTISEGIVTGLNKYYLLGLNEIQKNQLELKYFQKCVRGKEVRRNNIDPESYYVFYPYLISGGEMSVIDEEVFKKECPNYYNFLKSHQDEIMDRQYFKDSGKYWYELWNQRNIRIFDNEKILTPELSPSNNFAFSTKEYFYGDTVCGITLDNNSQVSLISLLAILNSKLIEFYYKGTTVPKAGGFYIYKVMYLKDIPIALPNTKQASRLDELQHKLVLGNTSDSVTERNIDEVVYELYGLTEEEIKIVEGKNNE